MSCPLALSPLLPRVMFLFPVPLQLSHTDWTDTWFVVLCLSDWILSIDSFDIALDIFFCFFDIRWCPWKWTSKFNFEVHFSVIRNGSTYSLPHIRGELDSFGRLLRIIFPHGWVRLLRADILHAVIMFAQFFCCCILLLKIFFLFFLCFWKIFFASPPTQFYSPKINDEMSFSLPGGEPFEAVQWHNPGCIRNQYLQIWTNRHDCGYFKEY